MRRIIFALTFCCLGWTGYAAADSSLDCSSGTCNAISCDAYVANAVAAAQKAADHKCGFGGARWSTDPNLHRQACLVSSVAFLNTEENTRTYDEFRCEICHAITDDAMKSVATATALHCDFLNKSPLWQTSAAVQYAACMQKSNLEALADPGYRQRAADIAACKRQNELRAGTTQGKSYSTMRREQREQMLEGGARKVLPCPPTLGINCNQPLTPAPKVSGPGLLEADGGFARQGPASAGTVTAPVVNPNSGRIR